MSATETAITTLSCLKPFTCSSYSPPISRKYPAGRFFWNSSILGIIGVSTWGGGSPGIGDADTVTVRNWFRRLIFGIVISVVTFETWVSGTRLLVVIE